MIFKFCGGLDCPDWILAEIAVLSKLTSIKFRLLCNAICESVIGGHLQTEKAEKILIDSGTDASKVKGCLAALTFILKSSAKYECSSTSLNNELQQLGLPSELVQQLCKVYDDHQARMIKSLKEASFRLPSITKSTGEISQTEDGVAFGRVTLKFDQGSDPTTVAMSKEKVHLLLKELTEAVGIMEQLETSSQ